MAGWLDKYSEVPSAQVGEKIPISESTNTIRLQQEAKNRYQNANRSNFPPPTEQPSLSSDNRTEEERKAAERWYDEVNSPSTRTQIGEGLQLPLRFMANPVKAFTSGYNEDEKESRKTQFNPHLSNKNKTKATLNEARDLGINALINAGTTELGFVGNGMMPRSIVPLFKQGSASNFTADLLQLSKTDWKKVKEGELDEIASTLINGVSTITHMGNFDAQQVTSRLKNWSNINKADKIDVLKDITNLGFAGGQQFQRETPTSSDTSSFFKYQNGGWLSKYDNGGKKKFLEPNDKKLPAGRLIPFQPEANNSELASSIGGEQGEDAYLIPTFKYGQPLNSPLKEYRETGEHLGGPFKTWQEADEWEQTVRHPYVEKNQSLPSPLKRWGKDYENGGWIVAQDGAPIRYRPDNMLEAIVNTNTPNIEDQRKWMKELNNSPKTRERLINSGMNKEDADLEIGRRDVRLSSVKSIDKRGSGQYFPEEHSIIVGNRSKNVPETATHELSHSSLSTLGKHDAILPSNQERLIKQGQSPIDYDKNIFGGYFRRPGEVKARVDALRYLGKDFYNAGNETFTKEHLDKLNKLNSDSLNDLKSVYKDEDIIRLMNDVAQNKQEEQPIQTAQNGITKPTDENFKERERLSKKKASKLLAQRRLDSGRAAVEPGWEPNVVQERLYDNIYPFNYTNPVSRVWNAVVKNKKDSQRKNVEESINDERGWKGNKNRMDAFNIYSGKPQKNNTFSVSKYSPSQSEEDNKSYYSINDSSLRNDIFQKYLLGRGDSKWIDDDTEAMVMGQYKVSKGKDKEGNYLSYYDKWDISPTDFGDPFEIYDRIYYDKEELSPPTMRKGNGGFLGTTNRGFHKNGAWNGAWQNGGEMSYYQNGLDFKPKSISRDGSSVPQAQKGKNIKITDSDGKERMIDIAEYTELYKSGKLATKNFQSDVYSVPPLPEVEIIGQKSKGRRWLDNYAQTISGETDGMISGMMAPANALLSLPQLAAVSAFTGKPERPSTALGIENPIGKLATDIALDPLNAVALRVPKIAGITKDAPELGFHALNSKHWALHPSALEMSPNDKKLLYAEAVLNRALPLIKKVGADKPIKKMAEKVMKQSSFSKRSWYDVTKNNKSNYKGNFDPENINKERDLIKLYLYGDEKGFQKAGKDMLKTDIGKRYDKLYPKSKYYIMDSETPHGSSVAPEFYEGKSPNKVWYTSEQDNPVRPFDNVGGHSQEIKETPEGKVIVSQDLWKFNPVDYTKKWGKSYVGEEGKEYYDMANMLQAQKQSAILDKLGKPFYLIQNNPIKAEEYKDKFNYIDSFTDGTYKQGGIIKDDMGYWNPSNFGKVVEIGSPDITMRGVDRELIGVSNTGDTKLLKPGKNYKFKGTKVREYPIAKYGINEVKELTDFSNTPSKKKNGGWASKYTNS